MATGRGATTAAQTTRSDVAAGVRARSSADVGARDLPDTALTLLQTHQVAQITPQLVADAERRLESALLAARNGRPPAAGRLLRQLATDLGITLTLH